jgi:hypothetical protein
MEGGRSDVLDLVRVLEGSWRLLFSTPMHDPPTRHRQIGSPTYLPAVIGLDGATDRLAMLCDDIWKLSRDAPGFFQRFTGIFSPADGTSAAIGSYGRTAPTGIWT